MDSWLMILTAWSVAIPASLLGVLLVMRKMVMVGDAISHAVLPGIVVAFLLTDSRDSFPMLLGAAVTGVMTTVFIDFLNKKIRIQQDAAIGTVFTFLFALGVLLIAFFAGKNTDLDQECVLYGDLETSILDQWIVGDYLMGTRAIWQLFPLGITVVATIVFGFKGWRVWAFNPDFGTLKGLKINRWHLVLMLLVSVHAVLSFESVGVIMVVGLLVLPAATASIMTNKMKRNFGYAVGIGMLSCVLGVMVAVRINISIAPTIVSINGVLFMITVLLASFLENKPTNRTPNGLQ